MDEKQVVDLVIFLTMVVQDLYLLGVGDARAKQLMELLHGVPGEAQKGREGREGREG